MSILFGHPTGNPNSHQAALAHFERGRLARFVVPWMPSTGTLCFLSAFPPMRGSAARLARRHFGPLMNAPKIQGRVGEIRRLATRLFGKGDEGLSYEANDWVMNTMRRECRRIEVTSVHSYEDASLWQFREAKRLGKACIYDMPIGYYPAWQETERQLAAKYKDWLPPAGLPSSRWVRPQQKREEMELADLVLAPSTFVSRTIRQFSDKRVAHAPYGVDTEFWRPSGNPAKNRPLTFAFAGQLSIRKGIPVLLQAWRDAALPDSELRLIGSWQLAHEQRSSLSRGVTLLGPCSSESLRSAYQNADVFVFPSFFEGFGLVLLEAMACGLPAIATTATAGADVLDESTGRLIEPGDGAALVESLRWFATHRDRIASMGAAARRRAEQWTWERYRRCVADAVSLYV